MNKVSEMSGMTFRRYFLEGWRPYLWIAAVIAAVYAKSISFGYTFLDDNVLILKNYDFLKDMTNIVPAFFRKVFADSYLPYYRPLLTVSFILDAQIGGTSLVFYHITNIIFHTVASCLVLVFLTRFGYEKLPSFLLSMIFAVHPVLSQGVVWIPGRNDTIMAVFILASFISLIGMLRTERWAYYAGHLIFFLLAIFTKETALVLIPVSLAYLYLIANERILSRNAVVLAVGWMVCAFLWYSCRLVAVRGSMDITVVDVLTVLFAYLPAAIQFMGKIFFPVNLSVFPIMQDTTYLYGVVSVAAIFIALLFTKQKRYNYIVFGFAWAILFLLPSLMRANYRISADFIEHRVYVPMIGLFIVLLETDLLKNMKKPAMTAAATLAIVGCVILTFIHIDNFRDRFAFWTNAVRTSPHSPFAHMAMGNIEYDSGRIDEAEVEYKKALALDPLEMKSLFGLGKVYLKKGMFKEAEKAFRKTLAVYPFYDNAYMELGVLYYKQGKPDEAKQAWIKAITIEPNNAEANKCLAIFYKEQKDYAMAAYYARQLRRMGLEPPADFMKSIGVE